VSLSHRKLSNWYRQLAQQLEAALPLVAALRSSRGTGAPASGLETMAATIESGGTVDTALHTATSWLPRADILALSAAAGAGRMPRTLHNLSARHALIHTANLKMILACAYPLLVLHVGILLFPIMRMIDWEKGFQWSTATYVRTLAMGLVPLWGLGVVTWILARRNSPVLLYLGRLLPGLRGYVNQQALADFAFALGNFLDAGIPIGRAWASAGQITRSPELKAAAIAVEEIVARGAAPGRELGNWPCFPADFVALYHTGESTGQLEANLHRLSNQLQESAHRSLAFATMLYPALMFAGVAVMVLYFVVTIYGGYLKMLGKLAE
jgi:type II secretory pathway component PulF